MDSAGSEILKAALLFVGALFPIVNPLGNVPIFLSLTRGYSSELRAVLARQIAFNGFMLLIVSILIGAHILAFFGISLPVVQVGGGMVVIATGWSLLQFKEDPSKANSGEISCEDAVKQAFYPLTLPLTVGPGSISVAITLGANAPHQTYLPVNLIGSALLGPAMIGVSIYLSYRFAERLAKLIGDTAMSVIIRLSSFILVCIGVQIMWNGVSALLATQRH